MTSVICKLDVNAANKVKYCIKSQAATSFLNQSVVKYTDDINDAPFRKTISSETSELKFSMIVN